MQDPSPKETISPAYIGLMNIVGSINALTHKVSELSAKVETFKANDLKSELSKLTKEIKVIRAAVEKALEGSPKATFLKSRGDTL